MRMYRFSHRIDERVRMVARSRRERMVAHDIADAPFLLPCGAGRSLSRIRRSGSS